MRTDWMVGDASQTLIERCFRLMEVANLLIEKRGRIWTKIRADSEKRRRDHVTYCEIKCCVALFFLLLYHSATHSCRPH
jgi:hypothetical protein